MKDTERCTYTGHLPRMEPAGPEAAPGEAARDG